MRNLLRLNRLGFLAWGWAMLLVIAVSAAPDGGAPGSRLVGSAFDPATASVMVGPQQPRVVLAATNDEQAPPAVPSGGAGEFATATSSAMRSPAADADGSLLAHRPPGSGDPRSLTRANGARAPPKA